MLKDTEVLKLYLFPIWSEWDSHRFDGFCKMRNLIQGDFGGIWMGCHRTDRIQYLDYVLGQLDRGLGYLKQHNPNLNEGSLQAMKYQYQKLRDIAGDECRGDWSYVELNGASLCTDLDGRA